MKCPGATTTSNYGWDSIMREVWIGSHRSWPIRSRYEAFAEMEPRCGAVVWSSCQDRQGYGESVSAPSLRSRVR